MQQRYHGMTRAQMNDAYNLTRYIPDSAALLDDFQQRSDRVYEQFPCQRNIQYAPAERTTLDYFPSLKKHAPTVIFIHGGFWQSTCKELFAFISDALLPHYQVILAEYTLAPEASMTQIIYELSTMLNYLQNNHNTFRLLPGKVCLAGHSAGGHLTAMLRSHPLISHAMCLSGVIDLTPISLCKLNDNLQLTPGEIQLFSPANNITCGVPTAVHVGDEERSEMLNHSDHYADLLEKVGNITRYTRLEGHDHFTLLNEFSPQGKLTQSMHQLFSE